MFGAEVQGVLARFGYQLTRVPQSADYGKVTPLATYAPWKADPEFLSVYDAIRSNTLVDLYRCWELWTLVQQVAKLDAGILEVGVWRGGTGALMAKQAQNAGIKAPVYLCDTFRGVVKASAHDSQYDGGEHSDTSRQTVERLLRSLGISNARLLEGIFPDETGHLVEPGAKFALCHIDVDVYQSARDVMSWVWDRIVPGGVVIYDDYGFDTCEGIQKFVNEQRAEADRLVFHNLNGHALVVKRVGV